MTSDQVALIQAQYNNANAQESNRINSERNQITRDYNDAMISLEDRKQNFYEEYSNRVLQSNERLGLLQDERDRLKIEYEHSDRRRQAEISERLADIQQETADIERDKADAEIKYKSDMADIQQERNYIDLTLGLGNLAAQNRKLDVEETKNANDVWLQNQAIEVQRDYNAATINLNRQKLKREFTINLFNAITSAHNSIVNAKNVENEAQKRKDTLEIANAQLALEREKYGTSKTQFIVDQITKPVNNLVYGVARGIASSLVSKYVGGIHVQTPKEAFESLFKD